MQVSTVILLTLSQNVRPCLFLQRITTCKLFRIKGVVDLSFGSKFPVVQTTTTCNRQVKHPAFNDKIVILNRTGRVEQDEKRCLSGPKDIAVSGILKLKLDIKKSILVKFRNSNITRNQFYYENQRCSSLIKNICFCLVQTWSKTKRNIYILYIKADVNLSR